jgi:hypothetical protein
MAKMTTAQANQIIHDARLTKHLDFGDYWRLSGVQATAGHRIALHDGNLRNWRAIYKESTAQLERCGYASAKDA